MEKWQDCHIVAISALKPGLQHPIPSEGGAEPLGGLAGPFGQN